MLVEELLAGSPVRRTALPIQRFARLPVGARRDPGVDEPAFQVGVGRADRLGIASEKSNGQIPPREVTAG